MKNLGLPPTELSKYRLFSDQSIPVSQRYSKSSNYIILIDFTSWAALANAECTKPKDSTGRIYDGYDLTSPPHTLAQVPPQSTNLHLRTRSAWVSSIFGADKTNGLSYAWPASAVQMLINCHTVKHNKPAKMLLVKSEIPSPQHFCL